MENPTKSKDNGAREEARDLRVKAEHVREEMAGKADRLREQMATRADRVTTQLGEKIESASQSVRERSHGEGRLSNTAGAMADKLQHAGTYLQETGFRGMASDVTGVVRRHPVQSLLVGAGLGYLIGRLTRR